MAPSSPSKRPPPTDDPEADADAASSSSDDDATGPALPSAAPPKKKRRMLPHEKLYLAALPRGTRYAQSLMHKDQVSFVNMTPRTDFLVTAGGDGQVSYWKKRRGGEAGVEFVKEFQAHGEGGLSACAVSCDGRSYATCGADGSIKVWDVETFDLVAVLSAWPTAADEKGVVRRPHSLCWVYGRGRGGVPLLAVGNDVDGEVLVLDGRGERQEPVFVVRSGALHRRAVVAMAYSEAYDCVVSADEGGMLEYWAPEEGLGKPRGLWEIKSATGLFEFKKAKSAPTSITMSPTGKQFATFSFPDRKVRVFDFASGKLYRTYDESIGTIMDMQQAGTAVAKLEDVEFGRRLAVERELESPVVRPRINVIFDETGNFILYGSLYGVKVINTLTNRVVKVYGKDEPFRSLNLALYQGQPEKKDVVTVQMAASENPLLQEAEARDAMLVSTGMAKVRFYMFTNDEEIERSTRDIQNEKPRQLGSSRQQAEAKAAELGTSAVIHTTYGDISVRLFPDAAPKAVENFVVHSRRGYYNNIIFHRVIRKFMIQTGDPLGDGTGGESIWGKEFEDEFSSYKHESHTLSMANSGPNTNGSQFFITTEKTPWLDDKHTVFGRAVQGLDVVHKIENTRTYKERPEEDIKIVNIDIT